MLLRLRKTVSCFPRLNNAGTAMIFVLVIAVIGNIVIGSVMLSNRYANGKSKVRRGKVSVLNIAEAGKEHFIAKVQHEGYQPPSDSTVLVFNKKTFGNGFYTVRCSTGANTDTMALRVKGEEGESSITIEVLLTKHREINFGEYDLRSKAAVVAKSDVSITGSIIIDGREHDSLKNVIGSGSYGIITEAEVDRQGNAKVGGNTLSPVKNPNYTTFRSLLCRENTPIDDSMNSPEAFLKLADGSLDKYKTTKAALSLPFKGLVYLEENAKLNLTGCCGVLIVHNSSKTAQLHVSKGNFKGLIICDVMDKATGQFEVIGSVVTLGESGKSHFGTGNSDIYYSKQVLRNLNLYCENISFNVEELSWREL